jgi:hypothetical protein
MLRFTALACSSLILLTACGDDSTPGGDGSTGDASTGDASTGGPPPGSSSDGPEDTTDGSIGTADDSSTGSADSTTGDGPGCGNGVVDPGELCDDDDLQGETCMTLGYDAGLLACAADCNSLDTFDCQSFNCGNGTMEDEEVCDGADLGGATCTSVDPTFDSGTLSCSNDCSTLQTTGCGTCGNVIVDGDEVCDTLVFLGQTCISQGFDSGPIGCSADCLSYDVADCGTCGNDLIDGFEVCDGLQLAGASCLDSPAFDSGTMGCDGSCEEFDTSSCTTVCGNGIIAGNEACEGADLQGATCANIGLGGGTLGCLPNCQFDITGCDDQFGVACDGGAPPTCIIGAFMAAAGGVTANLYAKSLDGTQTIDLGPLGVQITGLAFHPNGTLYGVDPGAGQLGIVGTTFPTSFTPVGPLVTAGGIAHIHVPDIAFMGTQLIGWSENGDDLVMINHTTGQVTVIVSPQGSAGTGMTYNSATDQILLAPSGSSGPLYTVNVMGGVTAGPTLGGVMGSVKGLAFSNGTLYGLDSSGGGNFVTYNQMTGAMTVLSALPHPNIDSLAIYDIGNLSAP